MHGETSIVLGTATRGLQLAVPIALSQPDRRRHLHVIGKTGTGKSTLLLNLMLSDLDAGRGFALLDPHGDLAESVVDAVPPERTNDVLYFNPSDLQHVPAFNPLDRVPVDQRPLVAEHLLAAFSLIWDASLEATPRLIYILLNALRLLLDAPGSTLLGLPRLLIDDAYRTRLLRTCRDPIVHAFWTKEFASYDHRFLVSAVSPIQNKIGVLLSPNALRNIIGQRHSTIDIPSIMNTGRVFIANLSKGKLGPTSTHLLGAFLATAFAQAAEARATMREHDRRDFTLFADEFQNFATESFASVLSEARKWRLALVLAHQYLGQIPSSLLQAVLGNTGSIIVFRVGASDADRLAPELGIESPSALADTANFSAWVKLIRDGTPIEPILIDTIYPEPTHIGRAAAVVARTRARHTRPRASVEHSIKRFLLSG